MIAPSDAAVEENACAAKRAIGEAHGHAAHHIVHHLVPIGDAQRIGASIAVDFDAEDLVVIVEVTGVASADHLGIVERGNAVDGDPAPSDLFDPDLVRYVSAEETTKAPIDAG